LSSIHAAAAQGFAAAAKAYRRGRPDYPGELLAWLRDVVGLSPGKTAVDLGAGTGKFTALLVRTGAQVCAVEPVEAMRAELATACPGVDNTAGDAQHLPFGEASVDAVLCAQAFHWFASREALEEIHRVLRPGAKLGLIWNVRDEAIDWVAAISRIIEPFEGDVPRFSSGAWRAPFDGTLFTDLDETRFRHTQVGMPREVIVDRFLSVSFIAALPLEEQNGVQKKLETLIELHPGLQGRATIEVPYETRAYVCTRRGG
jgi:SAM-dependent methyltransferase